MVQIKKIIPIFINHQGCPFQCVFCNQHTITGRQEEPLLNLKAYISAELIKYNKYEIELAFYGGTFTGLPHDLMLKYLEIANSFPKIQSIRISTRPDMITQPILKVLKESNVKIIELGVQSFDDEVLRLSKRGYVSRQVIESSALIRENNFVLGHQLMIGLPGEDRKSFQKSVDKMISLKPDMVRIYSTIIFEGTELAQLYKMGQYKPLTLERGVEMAAEAVSEIRKTQIEILRVGLHSVREENKILGGCYHPQFRYMVESQIVLNCIKKMFPHKFPKKMKIFLNPKKHNYFVGYKKENLIFLKKQGVQEITILHDETIEDIIINGSPLV